MDHFVNEYSIGLTDSMWFDFFVQKGEVSGVELITKYFIIKTFSI